MEVNVWKVTQLLPFRMNSHHQFNPFLALTVSYLWRHWNAFRLPVTRHGTLCWNRDFNANCGETTVKKRAFCVSCTYLLSLWLRWMNKILFKPRKGRFWLTESILRDSCVKTLEEQHKFLSRKRLNTVCWGRKCSPRQHVQSDFAPECELWPSV